MVLGKRLVNIQCRDSEDDHHAEHGRHAAMAQEKSVDAPKLRHPMELSEDTSRPASFPSPSLCRFAPNGLGSAPCDPPQCADELRHRVSLAFLLVPPMKPPPPTLANT
jgi:hypothetical protein